MTDDELKLTTEKINLYVLGALSSARYEHSVRVAVLARELCKRFGWIPESGYLAGLAHDMCKAGGDRLLFSLASQDGFPITKLEKNKPALLHGRAAAVLLSTEFKILDESILAAVRNHTFGTPGMDILGKIIFVADKIEPGRKGIDPMFRRKILSSELDEMVRLVLGENIRYLKSKGKEVASETLLMFESLKGGPQKT